MKVEPGCRPLAAVRRDWGMKPLIRELHIYRALNVDHDLRMLVQKAMNLALEEDIEKRGVKFAPPTHKFLSEEGGVSCA